MRLVKLNGLIGLFFLGVVTVAVLPIVEYPAEILAKRALPVTSFDENLKALAADMAETMYKAPGVGLAAPQIGLSLRLVVIDISDEKKHLLTLVNPTVVALTNEMIEGEEGCLSLPDLTEKIRRSAKVHVSALDLEGKPLEFDCEGLLAVCVQHEVDHLDGHVFIDHLSLLKRSRAIAKLAKLRKEKQREKKHPAP